jgi:uncharacterized membrane protein YjgN (DUF898 family)
MKLSGNIGVADILGHLIIWLIIIVLTLGIGIFFFPYSFAKYVLNHAEIEVNGQTHQLKCEINFPGQVGHIIIWAIISVITLGVGYLFYLYKVWNYALNHTTIQ